MRISILYFICGLLVTPLSSIGKMPMEKIDSLKSLLDQSDDSLKVEILLQISWNYRNLNADSALHYAEKGCKLADDRQLHKESCHGRNYMGIAYRNKSNYSKAMTLYFEALRVAEKHGDYNQMSYTLINIGNIYVIQGDYVQGLTYFEKALQFSLSLDDTNLTAYCHLNVGRALAGLKRFSDASVHYHQAKKIFTKNIDLDGTVIVSVDMADLFMATNKPDQALTLLKSNLPNIMKLGHQNTLAYNYINTAKAYLMKGQYDESLMYSDMALEISRSKKLLDAEIQALKNKAEVLEMQNHDHFALYTYKQYIAKKDSIFSEENSRKIADISSAYSSEKNESEKKSLKAQSEQDRTIIHRQQTVIFLAAVSAVLFFVMAIMAYKSYIQKNRLNEQIRKQKENAYRHNNKLIEINNEKNNLIRILSHDLRAPINNIKGLTMIHQLDHQDHFSEAENETLNLIKRESDRLLSMISKILNVESLDSEKSAPPMERVCINMIAEEVVTGFLNTAKAKNIKVKSHLFDKQYYILGDQIHLHQVIENLMSNAIKFSKPNKKIEIGLIDKGKKIQLYVRDQGPGLTADDQIKVFKKFQKLSAKPTGNEESTGLGLSIVKKYVEEMNGKIWNESTYGEGTTFYIEFDLVNEPQPVRI